MTSDEDPTRPAPETGDVRAHSTAGGTCAEALLEIEGSDPGAVASGGAIVEVDAAGRRPRALRVTGSTALQVTGPFRLLRADGSDLPPLEVVSDAVVTVVADQVGTGSVSTVPTACPLALDLVAVTPSPLAGVSKRRPPLVETAQDLFVAGDDAGVLIDPAVYTDRAGLLVDVVLVPHRDPTAWSTDPTLADAVATVPATLDGTPLTLPLPAVPAGVLLTGWDVVVDVGRDGRLDPGDLLDGLDTPALYVVGDLSEPGPYTPVRGNVDGVGVWEHQVVYTPTELATLPPPPLVVISHGNGHDYTWYDWLGNHLASWGYVVMSHKNNTGPGPQSAATTTLDNVDYLLGHLDTALGGALDGHLDSHTQIWIGHSRGGEGVVLAYDRLVTGTAHPANFVAEDVVSIASIAPTIFSGPDAANPHDVPFHILSGSADGDVTGAPSQGLLQYYRIFLRSTGLNEVTYIEGADHNDFNCCGVEDSSWVAFPGPLIGRQAAQRIAKIYFLASIEAEVGGQDPLWEVLNRFAGDVRMIGVNSPVVTQLRRASGDRKLVVDDFQRAPSAAVSSSGGAVTGTVRDLVEGALDDPDTFLTYQAGQAMNGMTWSSVDTDPAGGITFRWQNGDDAMLDFALPGGSVDLTTASALSLRACQLTRSPDMVQPALAFTVALVDGQGHETALPIFRYAGIPRTYRRGDYGVGTGWVNEFQTVRVPLTGFRQDSGLDLTDITTLRLRFGAGHGSPHGRLGLDDIEILTEATP